MRAVDTNVLVRLFARDDAQQTACAEDFIENGAWVSIPALIELLWVLSSAYGKRPADLMTTIEMLLKHRQLVVQDAEAVAAALDLFRARPALGFNDCLILHVAIKAGHLPLGTFDRKLAIVEGAHKL